ncbi:uncharacterized protein MAL13P1.304-like [Gordionus sp. m RMFG-2023]|uniref:uncharacterized protein MAL13P1.304-like n=1 Tax=Gordionus sp. m RMFG-2023 TaxID=3053472 RepID=UPI0031FD779D
MNLYGLQNKFHPHPTPTYEAPTKIYSFRTKTLILLSLMQIKSGYVEFEKLKSFYDIKINLKPLHVDGIIRVLNNLYKKVRDDIGNIEYMIQALSCVNDFISLGNLKVGLVKNFSKLLDNISKLLQNFSGLVDDKIKDKALVLPEYLAQIISLPQLLTHIGDYGIQSGLVKILSALIPTARKHELAVNMFKDQKTLLQNFESLDEHNFIKEFDQERWENLEIYKYQIASIHVASWNPRIDFKIYVNISLSDILRTSAEPQPSILNNNNRGMGAKDCISIELPWQDDSFSKAIEAMFLCKITNLTTSLTLNTTMIGSNSFTSNKSANNVPICKRKELREETAKDPILRKVKILINGTNIQNQVPELQAFRIRIDEIENDDANVRCAKPDMSILIELQNKLSEKLAPPNDGMSGMKDDVRKNDKMDSWTNVKDKMKEPNPNSNIIYNNSNNLTKVPNSSRNYDKANNSKKVKIDNDKSNKMVKPLKLDTTIKDANATISAISSSDIRGVSNNNDKVNSDLDVINRGPSKIDQITIKDGRQLLRSQTNEINISDKFLKGNEKFDLIIETVTKNLGCEIKNSTNKGESDIIILPDNLGSSQYFQSDPKNKNRVDNKNLNTENIGKQSWQPPEKIDNDNVRDIYDFYSPPCKHTRSQKEKVVEKTKKKCNNKKNKAPQKGNKKINVKNNGMGEFTNKPIESKKKESFYVKTKELEAEYSSLLMFEESQMSGDFPKNDHKKKDVKNYPDLKIDLNSNRKNDNQDKCKMSDNNDNLLSDTNKKKRGKKLKVTTTASKGKSGRKEKNGKKGKSSNIKIANDNNNNNIYMSNVTNDKLDFGCDKNNKMGLKEHLLLNEKENKIEDYKTKFSTNKTMKVNDYELENVVIEDDSVLAFSPIFSSQQKLKVDKRENKNMEKTDVIKSHKKDLGKNMKVDNKDKPSNFPKDPNLNSVSRGKTIITYPNPLYSSTPKVNLPVIKRKGYTPITLKVNYNNQVITKHVFDTSGNEKELEKHKRQKNPEKEKVVEKINVYEIAEGLNKGVPKTYLTTSHEENDHEKLEGRLKITGSKLEANEGNKISTDQRNLIQQRKITIERKVEITLTPLREENVFDRFKAPRTNKNGGKSALINNNNNYNSLESHKGTDKKMDLDVLFGRDYKSRNAKIDLKKDVSYRQITNLRNNNDKHNAATYRDFEKKTEANKVSNDCDRNDFQIRTNKKYNLNIPTADGKRVEKINNNNVISEAKNIIDKINGKNGDPKSGSEYEICRIQQSQMTTVRPSRRKTYNSSKIVDNADNSLFSKRDEKVSEDNADHCILDSNEKESITNPSRNKKDDAKKNFKRNSKISSEKNDELKSNSKNNLEEQDDDIYNFDTDHELFKSPDKPITKKPEIGKIDRYQNKGISSFALNWGGNKLDRKKENDAPTTNTIKKNTNHKTKKKYERESQRKYKQCLINVVSSSKNQPEDRNLGDNGNEQLVNRTRQSKRLALIAISNCMHDSSRGGPPQKIKDTSEESFVSFAGNDDHNDSEIYCRDKKQILYSGEDNDFDNEKVSKIGEKVAISAKKFKIDKDASSDLDQHNVISMCIDSDSESSAIIEEKDYIVSVRNSLDFRTTIGDKFEESINHQISERSRSHSITDSQNEENQHAGK